MHPFPITEMVEKEWYGKMLGNTTNTTVYFAIAKKDDNPVGFVTLKSINYTNKNCLLGIVIGDTNEQRKGYAKEAMELIVAYAFNTLNLNKITVEVVENNENALALYKMLGFTEEGKLKQHYYSDGEYLSVILLSIFKRNIK